MELHSGRLISDSIHSFFDMMANFDDQFPRTTTAELQHPLHFTKWRQGGQIPHPFNLKATSTHIQDSGIDKNTATFNGCDVKESDELIWDIDAGIGSSLQ
ncbi:hypothetical protein D3C72_2208760 [compost metagenome]